jgi:hypothetical protein
MVFVYSDVGKTLFREMGDIFIKFSLFFLIAVSIIFAVSIYPERSPYSLSLIIIFLVFSSIISIINSIKNQTFRIRGKILKITFTDIANYSFALAIIVIIFIIIIPTDYEVYISYLYAVGYIFIICYFSIAVVMHIYKNKKQ